MRVSILASGSGGNACVVESGRTRVLVDAGLSAREMERRMLARGIEPESIRGIFISHEHLDHSSGAMVFSSRWECPIFTSAGTADAIGLVGDLFSPFVRVDSGRDSRIGDLLFRAFATPHDANESVAYAFEADDARVVIASDLGRAEEDFVDFLKGSTTILLEFNHDEDMLRDGPYTWPLKQRISGGFGHLSNRQSAEAIRRAAWPGLKRVVATHISRTNNIAPLAMASLVEAIARADTAAAAGVAEQVAGFETFDA
ncbi:MAG TPA: MBL fold metallo-hydrolase [Thermoanaerobaculia bacterium]|jgi:phosphoribosyl 1,2-cyclic phosphodiesterase|nr:MBL fold metallo-hydrolase [Thermoanaerobaculia bacterium]